MIFYRYIVLQQDVEKITVKKFVLLKKQLILHNKYLSWTFLPTN